MERLDIFNVDRIKIGAMERAQVHEKGCWHQTFHCWFAQIIQDEIYLYIQKRQKGKDTFPEKFDITAAGHLMENEAPVDGIREIQEELGVEVEWDQLISLGVIANEIITADFIDREFSHVYLYQSEHKLSDFKLQEEEVSGIYLVSLERLFELLEDKRDQVDAEGIEIIGNEALEVKTVLTLTDFVPHQQHYYWEVLTRIKAKLSLLI
ncbi:NUDIX hydrolase [Brevibacillus ginsengisoli]|uniref:NUDIX hydrolase n=1 Tax=Brevibacillus ginsengisoli TaxID=363854 RepID=UPI003CFADB99